MIAFDLKTVASLAFGIDFDFDFDFDFDLKRGFATRAAHQNDLQRPLVPVRMPGRQALAWKRVIYWYAARCLVVLCSAGRRRSIIANQA